MSAALREITNDEGVILRYAPDVRGTHHDALRRWPSDRRRGLLLRAERELRDMRLMLECLEDLLSAAAFDRFEHALRTIEAALSSTRDEVGT